MKFFARCFTGAQSPSARDIVANNLAVDAFEASRPDISVNIAATPAGSISSRDGALPTKKSSTKPLKWLKKVFSKKPSSKNTTIKTRGVYERMPSSQDLIPAVQGTFTRATLDLNVPFTDSTPAAVEESAELQNYEFEMKEPIKPIKAKVVLMVKDALRAMHVQRVPVSPTVSASDGEASAIDVAAVNALDQLTERVGINLGLAGVALDERRLTAKLGVWAQAQSPPALDTAALAAPAPGRTVLVKRVKARFAAGARRCIKISSKSKASVKTAFTLKSKKAKNIKAAAKQTAEACGSVVGNVSRVSEAPLTPASEVKIYTVLPLPAPAVSAERLAEAIKAAKPRCRKAVVWHMQQELRAASLQRILAQ